MAAPIDKRLLDDRKNLEASVVKITNSKPLKETILHILS
jgi:hypothetical protein